MMKNNGESQVKIQKDWMYENYVERLLVGLKKWKREYCIMKGEKEKEKI